MGNLTKQSTTALKEYHRHPDHQKYLHLFEGVTSFKEFEAKLVAFQGPSANNNKGAAFEVFVWAYLATSPVRQAKEVWPRTDMLSEAMRAGHYPAGDKGVDGVFVTHDGLECAYQAKFHGDRSRSLTWNADKMANFIAHRGKADKLVLITNVDADTIDDAFKGDDFYAIRGRDFDELEAKDFAAMHQYIVDGKIEYKPKTPRLHQAEAVADIHAAMATGDRATSVMACGTGKTLAALWAAEQQVPVTGTVLVMVPTLALMRQNLHEWLGNTNWGTTLGNTPPAFLTVCSDTGVGRMDHRRDDDGMQQSIADMDFSPARDSDEVRQFLDRPSEGIKVIITTYQSLNVVQEAILAREFDPDFKFDFAFFDEAHKTAGHLEKTAAMALQDAGIPIKKRLFMTATPRHYKLKSKPEDEEQLVFSMDDKAVYGPIAHTLSFRKAANEKIIAPYKVIISVIEEDPIPINRDVLNSKDVAVKRNGKEDRVNARQVGLQLAIKQAAETHGLNRIITFHGETKHASQFVDKSVAGIGGHLDDFQTYHVSGKMPMSKRAQTMRAFREADRALISNAKCLTEGVDVPSVDMVVFTHTKRSTVDIVQAVGRAMRKSAGKDIGYVMVPVFLQPAEDIEAAVKSNHFDTVWEVLKSMSEHDETLADIIREMTVDKGKGTRTWSGNERLSSLIEIQYTGRALKIEDLRRAIGVRIVEQLGDNWDEMYGYLEQEKDEGREVNVAQGSKTPDGKNIGSWLCDQRMLYKRKSNPLSDDRIVKLESLGIEWYPIDARWTSMYDYLCQLKAEGKDVNVAAAAKTPDGKNIGWWLDAQRMLYKRKSNPLSDDRIVKLESLGIEWCPIDAQWTLMYDYLCQLKTEGKDVNMAALTKTPDGKKIGSWLIHQRVLYKSKSNPLSDDRIEKLEALGFEWNPLDAPWTAMYNYLRQLKADGKDVNVAAAAKTPDGKNIGWWLNNQRMAYQKKRKPLSDDCIEKLESLGVKWNTVDAQWTAMYDYLCRLKAEDKDVNVATLAKTPDGRRIGIWLVRQRTSYKNGDLQEDRVNMLGKIGVEWSPSDVNWHSQWTTMYDYLSQMKAEGKDVNVAALAKTPDGKNIGSWVRRQRKAYKDKTLSDESIEKLTTIGVRLAPSVSITPPLVATTDDSLHAEPITHPAPTIATSVNSTSKTLSPLNKLFAGPVKTQNSVQLDFWESLPATQAANR